VTHLQLDIVSDIACPWCAIGYARLAKAMAELKDETDFSIHWHAFELNPDPASAGVPILEALSSKYGRSQEEMKAGQDSMMAIAADLGLNFDKLQDRLTSNTFDAHRLVKWAGQEGRQTDMKLALFEACFGRGENMSDPEVLVRCAEAAGLPGEQARTILTSGQYSDEVRADEARYQQAGISSVPAYIVNGKYLISGAQEPAAFVQAFREIMSEER